MRLPTQTFLVRRLLEGRGCSRVRLPASQSAGIVGVMEFFSRDRLEPDERLLETMGVLGSQVGQFVARRQAEGEVRASESRLKAMLASALDAVVTMDHHGCVLGWNHAAETTFGYRADEVVGRDMADLIVPPSLRDSTGRASRASSRPSTRSSSTGG